MPQCERWGRVIQKLDIALAAIDGSENDLGQSARKVLRLVTSGPAIPMQAEPANPLTCPNCGKPCQSTRSPYCSEECRSESAFVRQFRSGLISGALQEPERQIAFGQNLWHILGGGYPLRRGMIPEKAAAKVIERDGGKCSDCGAPATTVEHVKTACNRPINLRAVCDTCNRTKPFGDVGLLNREEAQAKIAELRARVGSPHAMKVSDDFESWDWRAFLKGRA